MNMVPHLRVRPLPMSAPDGAGRCVMETLRQTLERSPVTQEQVEALRAVARCSPFVTIDDPDDPAWQPVDALLTYGCLTLIASTPAQEDGTPGARIVEVAPFGRALLQYRRTRDASDSAGR